MRPHRGKDLPGPDRDQRTIRDRLDILVSVARSARNCVDEPDKLDKRLTYIETEIKVIRRMMPPGPY